MPDFYDKDQLQNWLATVVPNAPLQITSLPLCPELELYLLVEDCQQGPYSSSQTELIILETSVGREKDVQDIGVHREF